MQGNMMRRTHHRALVQGIGGKIAGIVAMLTGSFLAASQCFGGPATSSPPNMFRPASTPADAIFHISIFVLIIARVIFAVVFSLMVYSLVKFRRGDDGREPPQVYGSAHASLIPGSK
jgi:heme/copper-type cytochrome/quinol oxidase subunit 2